MEKRNYIEVALTERLSLRGICRVFQVSLTRLQDYAHRLWELNYRVIIGSYACSLLLYKLMNYGGRRCVAL